MTHTVDDSIKEMRLLLDDINDDPDEIYDFMIPKEWFWLVYDLDMDQPYSHSTQLPINKEKTKVREEKLCQRCKENKAVYNDHGLWVCEDCRIKMEKIEENG